MAEKALVMIGRAWLLSKIGMPSWRRMHAKISKFQNIIFSCIKNATLHFHFGIFHVRIRLWPPTHTFSKEVRSWVLVEAFEICAGLFI